MHIRHVEAPRAMGCRWCGYTACDHRDNWWVPGHGFHEWEQPTREQIEARMRARFKKQDAERAARRAALVVTS